MLDKRYTWLPNLVQLLLTNKYKINKRFETGFWLNPAPKDDLIVLQVVTYNIGTLEGVHLVKFDEKPNITIFFFTKCTLVKCYPQSFAYHHHPHRSSEYLRKINGTPLPASEIFPGFNFLKIYLVPISFCNSGKTVVLPALVSIIHVILVVYLYHLQTPIG